MYYSQCDPKCAFVPLKCDHNSGLALVRDLRWQLEPPGLASPVPRSTPATGETPCVCTERLVTGMVGHWNGWLLGKLPGGPDPAALAVEAGFRDQTNVGFAQPPLFLRTRGRYPTHTRRTVA